MKEILENLPQEDLKKFMDTLSMQSAMIEEPTKGLEEEVMEEIIAGKFKPKNSKKNPFLESREWAIITQLASINGIKLKEPDMSCKYCNGKGWTGIETYSKAPIACKCIIWDISEMKVNPMAKGNLDRKQWHQKLEDKN